MTKTENTHHSILAEYVVELRKNKKIYSGRILRFKSWRTKATFYCEGKKVTDEDLKEKLMDIFIRKLSGGPIKEASTVRGKKENLARFRPQAAGDTDNPEKSGVHG